MVERCLALLILDVVRNPECVLNGGDEVTEVSPNGAKVEAEAEQKSKPTAESKSGHWKDSNHCKTLKGSLTKVETELAQKSEENDELQSELATKEDEIEKLEYKVKKYADQAGAKAEAETESQPTAESEPERKSMSSRTPPAVKLRKAEVADLIKIKGGSQVSTIKVEKLEKEVKTYVHAIEVATKRAQCMQKYAASFKDAIQTAKGEHWKCEQKQEEVNEAIENVLCTTTKRFLFLKSYKINFEKRKTTKFCA